MRYGPHTAEIERFFAWLGDFDAARAEALFAGDPRPWSPEMKAAYDRHQAAPGTGAAWVSALNRDAPKVGVPIRDSGLFAGRIGPSRFWSLFTVATYALQHRGHLDPADFDLLTRPFRAAGYDFDA